MAMFLLDDATGIGSNDLDTLQAFIDLVVIADDDGVGMDDPVNGLQLVTYTQTVNGPPQDRLNALVNTAFTPDFGGGAQNVDTIVIAGLSGFTLDDGTSFQNNGTALPPASSGLPGSTLNTTENCLVIYDTQQNICVARDGTGGDLDLPISNPVVLYHEFSHAFRIVNNTLLALGGGCDPSSPEENAAIIDENDLRTQIANRQGTAAELRDPNIHCGQVGCDSGCCIIATVASRSLSSTQVQFLRGIRDHFVRSTEVGFAFFERFFRDYYAFSPQVCTLMARHAGISDQLLEGYIEPLLEFWSMMIVRSKRELSESDLGRMVLELHTDIERAQRRRLALERTATYWKTSDQATEAEVPAELLALLRERAWPSEYMQWAIIAPVSIYYDLLVARLDGEDEAALGRKLQASLDAWTARVPISDVWGALSMRQVQRELRFCHRALMHTEVSRRTFRQRILDRFPDVTSIRQALIAPQPTMGAV